MAFRLTIAPAPVIAAPTPEFARKVEAWHAADQPAAQPIAVPVMPQPAEGSSLSVWLTRFWPTVKPEYLPISAYVTELDKLYSPQVPATAIEPWAHMAARGYFELEWGAKKGVSGANSTPLKGSWSRTPFGPLDQYSALIVQARGADDLNARAAVMAYVTLRHCGDSLAVYAALQKPDWPARIDAMAK